MKKRWHRYRYKNLTLLFVSLILSIILFKMPWFRYVLLHIGNLGYFGAFVGGMLFSSTFTVSFGAVILLFLAETLNPVAIGIIAGVGAVLIDLTIFDMIRSKNFIDEIRHFFMYFGGDKVSHLIHTKYFSWTMPVLGAAIIASPLPDEIGVSLMGISSMKVKDFIILSFVLNSIGIFLAVSVGNLFRP